MNTIKNIISEFSLTQESFTPKTTRGSLGFHNSVYDLHMKVYKKFNSQLCEDIALIVLKSPSKLTFTYNNITIKIEDVISKNLEDLVINPQFHMGNINDFHKFSTYRGLSNYINNTAVPNYKQICRLILKEFGITQHIDVDLITIR